MPKRISLQGRGAEIFFAGVGANAAPVVEDTPAPMHARTHAPITEGAQPEDVLFRGLSDKQRLASSTFRFQAEELERLDAVFEELNRIRPRRVSKNDVVRLGLRWLLADYESNPSNSLLSQLLERA